MSIRAVSLLLLLLLLPAGARGMEVPDRFGGAVSAGHAYDPESRDVVLLTAVALFDYDRIWPHRAPDPLRFKVEGSLGAATIPQTRLMVSAHIFALYYLDRFASSGWRPYVEAGIGLNWADFRVRGQAWRLNFNPQAGIGAEYGDGWFAALRHDHRSNGGLHHDNRGTNGVVLQLGRYF